MSHRGKSSTQQAKEVMRSLDARGTPRFDREQNKKVESGKVHGKGTYNTYQGIFIRVANWLKASPGPTQRLHFLTVADANRYIDERSEVVGQKMLNNERQALEMYLRKGDGKYCDPTNCVNRVQSERVTAERSRAYSDVQVRHLSSHQSERLSLSTRLADAAGLRASELLSLRPLAERGPSSHREWSADRYRGRENWVRYSVDGKGGLVREVRLPPALAAQLEARRLEQPRLVLDRNIKIWTHYEVSGGRNFSNQFSAHCKKEFGWSAGAHGLRHSFAQRRMYELTRQHLSRDQALAIVSQELGHFRPDITEVYLR